VFNPNEIADNLKKSGAFVPGIRPGIQTANYIDKPLSGTQRHLESVATLLCLCN
jgi:preprotein translocase subunit SecY